MWEKSCQPIPYANEGRCRYNWGIGTKGDRKSEIMDETYENIKPTNECGDMIVIRVMKGSQTGVVTH